MNVEDAVWSALSRHLIAPLNRDHASTTQLLQEGYLDSLGIVALMFDLEKEFHLKLKPTDVGPADFENFSALVRFVSTRVAV